MKTNANLKFGFTLVEITLAIAIVSFAFLSVFGMIPTGLSTFRQAMDVSIGSDISQRVLNDLQQTDFGHLVGDSAAPGSTRRFVWDEAKPDSTIRYFDDQGGELSADKVHLAVYQVNARIMPETVMPNTGGDPGDVTNSNLATVTVQVARNPAGRPLALTSAGNDDVNEPLRNLWTGAYESDPDKRSVVPILTTSIRISRTE